MVATTTLPISRSEAEKRRQLAVNKRRATGLLVVVAAVFVVTIMFGDDHGWDGYLRATAEASLVGGLADWFAVTALFRHPMGIPIPHTAIVPERKEQFGQTLGEFVEQSFLTPETIVDRVRHGRVGVRAAQWLATPENADRMARHILDGAIAVADLVRDEDVHRTLEDVVRTRLEQLQLAPLAGRALELLTAEDRHEELIDAALRGLERYLDTNRENLHDRFSAESPWWLPGAVEDRIFARLLDGVRTLLADVASNRNHSLRIELDQRIDALVHELKTSPDLAARGDQLKRDLLAQPQLREWVADVWRDVKRQLRVQAEDPESELRRRLAEAIVSTGERLRDDTVLAGRIDDAVESAVRYVAEHFHGEISAMVNSTIARWDAEETSLRLELLLGPDLQFIRINGTVVGGAAGLALHTISKVLG